MLRDGLNVRAPDVDATGRWLAVDAVEAIADAPDRNAGKIGTIGFESRHVGDPRAADASEKQQEWNYAAGGRREPRKNATH
jgi:hypothetical protein